jgi:segregation and condensation protein B
MSAAVLTNVREDSPSAEEWTERETVPELPAEQPGPSDHAPASSEPVRLRIEALLLASDRPLSDGKIAEILGISLEEGGTRVIRQAIEELNGEYGGTGRSFRIEQVAGGRQILTRPEFGPVLHRLHQSRSQSRLTPAALETLAIVAYRQPVLRADIEAIRGVASGEVLRGLMERRLVKIVGRAEELGRPMLYGTTREFLRVFGLASLSDLPQAKELRIQGLAPAPAASGPAETPEAAEPESHGG